MPVSAIFPFSYGNGKTPYIFTVLAIYKGLPFTRLNKPGKL
jgi:hypothetical protein